MPLIMVVSTAGTACRGNTPFRRGLDAMINSVETQ